MFVEFILRFDDESVVNNAPPLSDVHSVIFVKFKLIVEDDEPFRYNAPPLELAVQFVISDEWREREASERMCA